MPRQLLIRADAGVRMGTGHVMRMLALAQAWHLHGGETVFACAEITPALEERLGKEGFRLEKISAEPGSRQDLTSTLELLSQEVEKDDAPCLALDGYRFDGDFQSGLKTAGCRLLVVDDYGHAGTYYADWVLNQNVSAREELYTRRDNETKLLLGPRYALLRKEFWAQRRDREMPERARNVLVTLGGSDPDNLTGKILRTIAGSSLQFKVVLGGSNPHAEEIRELVAALSTNGTAIELLLNPPDMPDLMRWADVAVCGGGSTSLELAFNGLPAIFLVLADNQQAVADGLERAGCGISFGRGSDFAAEKFVEVLDSMVRDIGLRRRFSAAGRSLVDGRGSQRVASLLAGSPALELRSANAGDVHLLWEWANDPQTRANSFLSSPIPWDAHQAWCRAKLEDPLCSLWIASDRDHGSVGCVRLERTGREATISVSVDAKARGRGYGGNIIRMACEEIFRTSEVGTIHAFVKPENIASFKVFASAGFQPASDAVCHGQPAKHLLLHKES
jgi:UDP-2,4-diacetamido-2,4,6-trideoxy-beta-L-altropyranose hydrolase